MRTEVAYEKGSVSVHAVVSSILVVSKTSCVLHGFWCFLWSHVHGDCFENNVVMHVKLFQNGDWLKNKTEQNGNIVVQTQF